MEKVNFIPDGLNKSVYFILPLLGLSKFSFGGGDNFYNSYIGYNGEIVAVIKEKSIAGEYFKHSNYLTDFDLQMGEDSDLTGTAILYKLPDAFTDDLSKFMDGKYSLMSETAKINIRELAGLPYRTAIPGSSKVNTHKLLLVLERNESLKKWIEKTCDIVIPDGQELLEKPHYDHEYIDVNTVVL